MHSLLDGLKKLLARLSQFALAAFRYQPFARLMEALEGGSDPYRLQPALDRCLACLRRWHSAFRMA